MPRFSVRVNPDEEQRIRALARAARKQPNTFLRDAALGAKMAAVPEVPAVNLTAWADLGRLANNVNQIARVLNEATADGHAAQLFADELAVLDAVRVEIRRLRSELRGYPADTP